MYGEWRQRECVSDRNRKQCPACADGDDRGKPGDHHAGSELDADVVIDECDFVHGERRVERDAVDQRNDDRDSHCDGDRYLYADLHRGGWQREPIRKADGECSAAADPDRGYFSVTGHYHAGSELDADVVIDKCDCLRGERRVERQPGNKRAPASKADGDGYRRVQADLYGSGRQREQYGDANGECSGADGDDRGEPDDNHAGSELDTDVVFNECGGVRGERGVER